MTALLNHHAPGARTPLPPPPVHAPRNAPQPPPRPLPRPFPPLPDLHCRLSLALLSLLPPTPHPLHPRRPHPRLWESRKTGMDKGLLLIPASRPELGWAGGYESRAHDAYTDAKTPGTLHLSFKLESLMTFSHPEVSSTRSSQEK